MHTGAQPQAAGRPLRTRYSTSLIAAAVAAATLGLSGCLSSSSNSDDRADAPTPAPATAELTLANGSIKGIVEDETLVWHGIPYARPPVGELRWRAPQPPQDWTGTLDASVRASECVQAETTSRWQRTSNMVGSEDCLYLDVYRPNRPGYEAEDLPVYVWIHGGSNNFGTTKQYDLRALAERSNVVVVAIQYRLGPLGWFFHPDVQTGGVDALSDSGNFGTLDTVRALEWIEENIQAFGGNPDNVTITGESAGAHNVLNLLVSPKAEGLFDRAVSQSGAMNTRTPAAARASANQHIEWVIRLREDRANPGAPLTAQQATDRRIAMENDGSLNAYLQETEGRDFYQAVFTYSSLSSYGAIEDGTVIPQGGWMPAFRSGNFNNVPLILGANEYEQKAFMPLYGGAIKQALPTIPSGNRSWLDLIDVAHEANPTLDEVLPTQQDKDVYEITGYYGSRSWRAKYVDELASVISVHQPQTYAYDFRWGGVGSGPEPFDFIYGAGHSGEIPFFFGGEQGLFGLPFTEENRPGRVALQNAMMAYMADFVRDGNPNGQSSSDQPSWEPWTNANGDKVIIFDADKQNAQVQMSDEGLTLAQVNAAWTDAMTAAGLGPTEQGTLRGFFGQAPHPAP